MSSFQYIALFLLLLTINGLSKAESSSTIRPENISDGLTRISSNSVQVTGPDPYIILATKDLSDQLQAQSQNQQNSRLIRLPLEISGAKSDFELSDVKGELFFNYRDSDKNFDPNYKLRFSFHSERMKQLVLAISPDIRLSKRALRLDFDGCEGCIIKYGPEFQIMDESSPIDASVTRIEPYRVHNGVQGLSGTELDIEITKLHLNDISKIGDRWLVSGGDPYFTTPDMDIDTETLGGVMFSLSRPHLPPLAASPSSTDVQDFQLFYATNSQAFLERESIIFRVIGKPGTRGSVDFNFFVPLEFVRQGYGEILQQLRLDITSHGGLSDEALATPVDWSINSIRLISRAGLEAYNPLLPIRLARSTSIKNSERKLINSIGKRLAKDWGFIFIYLALISLFIVNQLRKFRLSNK